MTGIVCPKCGGDTKVTETRTTDGQIRRRRRCLRADCAGRVTTIEMAVFGPRRGLKLTGDAVLIQRAVLDRLREARDELDLALASAGDPDSGGEGS